MYASTQVHRRHHFQTRIGRELGEKFSQVKKARNEGGRGKKEKERKMCG